MADVQVQNQLSEINRMVRDIQRDVSTMGADVAALTARSETKWETLDTEGNRIRTETLEPLHKRVTALEEEMSTVRELKATISLKEKVIFFLLNAAVMVGIGLAISYWDDENTIYVPTTPEIENQISVEGQ